MKKYFGFSLFLATLFVIFLYSVPRVFAQATATPTPTLTSSPTPTPTGAPNSCNGTCGSDSNCQSGLVCYQGFCRNPSCQSQISCNCPTATAAPTTKPTINPTLTPTAKPTVTPTFTPTEAPTQGPIVTDTPIPTESATPAKSSSSNLKGLAILILMSGFLIIIAGVVYLKIKNKNGIPPIRNLG